jgi:hypothetical protein
MTDMKKSQTKIPIIGINHGAGRRVSTPSAPPLVLSP